MAGVEHTMSGTRLKNQYAPHPWLSTHGRLDDIVGAIVLDTMSDDEEFED